MNEYYINIYLPTSDLSTDKPLRLTGYVHKTLEDAVRGRTLFGGGLSPDSVTVKVVPAQVIPATVGVIK